MQVNNLCFFRNVRLGNEVLEFSLIDNRKNEKNITYTNDTITTPENRISCFRVSYRKASDQIFETLPFIFGVRSLSTDAVFNYLRFEFISPDAEAETIYEFKLTPVSGYEVRNSVDQIQILDYKNGNRVLVNSGDVNVIFTGVLNATRTEDVFSVPTLTTVNGQKIDDDSGVGLFFEDFYPGSSRGYYSDAWARVAEFFMHEELRATTQQPEHQHLRQSALHSRQKLRSDSPQRNAQCPHLWR